MPDYRTMVRQTCQRCYHIDRAPFMTTKAMWRLVAGPHWEDAILCLPCFAEIGDEKGIEWDAGGIEVTTDPYVQLTHRRATVDRLPVSNEERLVALIDAAREWRRVEDLVATADEYRGSEKAIVAGNRLMADARSALAAALDALDGGEGE